MAGFFFRQSKSGPADQNPKCPADENGWAYRSRARIHDVRGGGSGAAAGGNSPDRNSEPVLRGPSFRPGSKHFANGCASLAMSKEKTLSLSTDMQKGNANGCLTLQPNWSAQS